MFMLNKLFESESESVMGVCRISQGEATLLFLSWMSCMPRTVMRLLWGTEACSR